MSRRKWSGWIARAAEDEYWARRERYVSQGLEPRAADELSLRNALQLHAVLLNLAQGAGVFRPGEDDPWTDAPWNLNEPDGDQTQ